MRISPWHLEIARRVAQGRKNKEILSEIAISPSRLSVLKANTLFQQEVTRYRQVEEDKYKKAVEVFANKAEAVAERITEIATQKGGQDKDTLKAGEMVLDKLLQSSGGMGSDEEELTFEQTLKVVRRIKNPDFSSAQVLDPSSEFEALQTDLEPAQDIEVIELEPLKPLVTFTKEIRTALSQAPVASIGDNGGKQRYSVSPRLKALLKEVSH